MKFTNLEDLKNTFIEGKFKMDDQITISGVPLNKRYSPEIAVRDIFEKNFKGIVIYVVHQKDKDAAKEAGLEQWVMFLWAGVGTRVVPYDVRTITKARALGKRIIEGLEKYEKPDNIIGSTVEVKITSLPGSTPIKGKVDTGATICSLHADNFKINRGENTITFKSPDLSSNELTVPLIDQQTVKSADGGSEYRPVIEFNIKVNGKIVNNVKFNLNDRSHMEFPMLVGRNALEGGKFLIDPRLDEDRITNSADDGELNWDYIQEELSLELYTEPQNSRAEELYTLIKESDVSFADIVRHIRTDVTENIMEDLDN